MKNGAIWLGLIGWIIVCLGAGAAGAATTASEIDGWYGTLEKPTWNPPNWVFGPVWTTLYLMMSVSAWLVWKSPQRKSLMPLYLFIGQLVLNVAWSWVFFGLHEPGWAFLEIVFLWLAIVATIISFTRCSPIAAIIMLPYLAWVTFASFLNFSIWQMN